ncbi:hypothetical protein NHQ30_002525 [Ciborinia camelliae]|nr:hypothetical protein NHQ30_002525 [Ciborinia camelliae]
MEDSSSQGSEGSKRKSIESDVHSLSLHTHQTTPALDKVDDPLNETKDSSSTRSESLVSIEYDAATWSDVDSDNYFSSLGESWSDIGLHTPTDEERDTSPIIQYCDETMGPLELHDIPDRMGSSNFPGYYMMSGALSSTDVIDSVDQMALDRFNNLNTPYHHETIGPLDIRVKGKEVKRWSDSSSETGQSPRKRHKSSSETDSLESLPGPLILNRSGESSAMGARNGAIPLHFFDGDIKAPIPLGTQNISESLLRYFTTPPPFCHNLSPIPKDTLEDGVADSVCSSSDRTQDTGYVASPSAERVLRKLINSGGVRKLRRRGKFDGFKYNKRDNLTCHGGGYQEKSHGTFQKENQKRAPTADGIDKGYSSNSGGKSLDLMDYVRSYNTSLMVGMALNPVEATNELASLSLSEANDEFFDAVASMEEHDEHFAPDLTNLEERSLHDPVISTGEIEPPNSTKLEERSLKSAVISTGENDPPNLTNLEERSSRDAVSSIEEGTARSTLNLSDLESIEEQPANHESMRGRNIPARITEEPTMSGGLFAVSVGPTPCDETNRDSYFPTVVGGPPGSAQTAQSRPHTEGLAPLDGNTRESLGGRSAGSMQITPPQFYPLEAGLTAVAGNVRDSSPGRSLAVSEGSTPSVVYDLGALQAQAEQVEQQRVENITNSGSVAPEVRINGQPFGSDGVLSGPDSSTPTPTTRDKGKGVARDKGKGVSRDKGEGVTQDKGKGASREKGKSVSRDKGKSVIRGRGRGVTRGRGTSVTSNTRSGTLDCGVMVTKDGRVGFIGSPEGLGSSGTQRSRAIAAQRAEIRRGSNGEAGTPQMQFEVETEEDRAAAKRAAAWYRDCHCHVMMTTRLPSPPPGLNVWVDGVSNRKTLEMLGFLPDHDEKNVAVEASRGVESKHRFPKDAVINYLHETSPRSMHLCINGEMRSSQVEDKSEDYAIVREMAGASERYWVFDIEDTHCATCCKTMRDQRRREADATARWHSRAKGAWRHQHCMNSNCHAACDHECRVIYLFRRPPRGEKILTSPTQPHHVLSRLGLDTTRKIKYVHLTSSAERMDPDILASAIMVLKPFVDRLEGLEITLASPNPPLVRRHLLRHEARRFVCCLVELEAWLVEGARLKVRGLEDLGELGELENMWGGCEEEVVGGEGSGWWGVVGCELWGWL